jgi:hypothetical protein
VSRRNRFNNSTYNYLPDNTLSSNVRGVIRAYVFRTNPPVFSVFPGELGVGQSVTVNISANNTHNLTGIFMRNSQTFRFTTASPEWNNGSRETNCNGYPGSILDRHGDINEMALTGELFEQNNSSRYTGHYFRIGFGTRTHTVTKTGFLICFANDIITAYGDNSRVVRLTVTRTQ